MKLPGNNLRHKNRRLDAATSARKEKKAALVPLGDDTTKWSSLILSNLYKQHSYLGGYKLDMQIEAEDQSLGAAQGFWILESDASTDPFATNEYMEMTPEMEEMYNNGVPGNPAPSTFSPTGKGGQPQPTDQLQDGTKAQSSAIGKTRIPFFVEEGKLHPMEVFITRENVYKFLNERNIVSEMAGSFGKIQQSQQPMSEDGASISNGVTDDVGSASLGRRGLVKTASRAKGTLLDILSTVDSNSRNRVVTFLKNMPSHISDRLKNKIAMINTAPYKPVSYGRLLSARLEREGTTYTLTSVVGGKIKKADLSVHDLNSIPRDMVEEVLTSGKSVRVQKHLRPISEEIVELPVIKQSGLYRLFNTDGSVEDTLVFRSTGKHSVVVTNEGARLASGLRGIRLSDQTNRFLEKSAQYRRPKAGYSGFFVVDNSFALPPVTLLSGGADFGGKREFIAQDCEGTSLVIELSDIVNKPVVQHNHAVLPGNVRFVATKNVLGEKVYEDTTKMLDKKASRSTATSEVFVSRSHYDKFRFDYRTGKLQTTEHVGNVDDAILVLRGLGLKSKEAKKIVDSVGADPHRIQVLGPIVTPDRNDVVVPFSLSDKEFTGLMKIASKKATPTIDAVLSLQFVNAENARKFVDFLPMFEELSSKVAELFAASIIGYREVSTTACQSALRALDKIISGLREIEMSGFENAAV